MELGKALRDPWVWTQMVLILLVAIATPVTPRYINLGDADFLLNRVDPTWIRLLSALPMAGGLLLIGWGARSLGRNLTPGTEPVPDSQLITGGPYVHFRHPMYAGAVLLLAGYTLAWSNWTLALLVSVVAAGFFGAKARAEERWLVQRFPEYQSYMAHVPRRLL